MSNATNYQTPVKGGMPGVGMGGGGGHGGMMPNNGLTPMAITGKMGDRAVKYLDDLNE